MSVILPRVTICIPTVERLQFLKQSVQSALSQDYSGPIEILVSVDWSESPLRTSLLAWLDSVKADPRVKVQSASTKLGLSGNWNFLVENAEGCYLMIIGDDDRLLPSCVSALVDAALRAQADVTFSDHWIIDEGGQRNYSLTERCTAAYGRALLEEGLQCVAQQCVWRNSIPMTAALLRRGAVLPYGFRTDLNTPELELFARLAADGRRFAFVARRLAEYRTHAHSATTSGLTIATLFWYLHYIPALGAAREKRKLMNSLLLTSMAQEIVGGRGSHARRMLTAGYLSLADLFVNAKLIVLAILSLLPGHFAQFLARLVKHRPSVSRG